VGPRIFVVAGEVSGDINAAHLVRELRRRDPSLSVSGVGGQYLASAGVSLFLDSSMWGTIGWLRASQFTLVPKLLQIEREIRRAAPDLLLVVDFAAFNLRLAERLNGFVPIVYYFPPMVSVRRGDRARKVARLDMRLLAAFRPEAAAYQAAGADVVFVGHPAVDLTKPRWTPRQARAHFQIPEQAPVIGLLPGSRVSEINTHLPVMMRAADILWQKSPQLHFLIPLASEQFRTIVTRHATSTRFPVRVVSEPYDAMAISEVIVTATGTATLEAAVLAVPMIAVYRLPWLSWMIAHYVLTVRRAALPNILSKRDIVPELLQDRMTPEAIASEVRVLLDDPIRRRQMQMALREVASDLGSPGVVQRAADEVFAVLDRS
jgi:lipid-A-disaccharide synthase